MKGPLSMLARLLGHLGKGRRGECVQLCTSGITEEGGEAAGVSAPMGHTHMEAFRVSLKADLPTVVSQKLLEPMGLPRVRHDRHNTCTLGPLSSLLVLSGVPPTTPWG